MPRRAFANVEVAAEPGELGKPAYGSSWLASKAHMLPFDGCRPLGPLVHSPRVVICSIGVGPRLRSSAAKSFRRRHRVRNTEAPSLL